MGHDVPVCAEDNAGEVVQLTEKVLSTIHDIYTKNNIVPNDVQIQMLHSHVKAMAWRSLTGEPLPDVEAELFEDITPEAMALAMQIVELFGNLPQEEAWMLSVHIEVARNNI